MTKTQVTVGLFKMSKTAAKEWKKLEKAMKGMTDAQRLAYVAQYDANKAMKKRRDAQRRRMKNLRQGKVWRPNAPKPSPADGSDSDRSRTFNAIKRQGGFW